MEAESKITTECPHCRKRFSVRIGVLGKRAKCGKCGQAFEVAPVVEVEYEEAPLPQPAAYTEAAPQGEVEAGGWPAEPEGYTPPPPARAGSSRGKKKAPPPKHTRRNVLIGIWAVLFLVGLAVKFRDKILSSTPETVTIVPGGNAPASPSSATPAPTPPPKLRPVPALVWTKDEAGRGVGTATASVRSSQTKVRVMLPAGTHADKSLPCVFVCPAGSNLMTGAAFGDSEQSDFYGLLERGLAVCFFTLDGTPRAGSENNDMAMAISMQSFMGSGAGLGNLQDAIDTVLAGTPAVDPQRLGTMGHSSAGTVALGGAGNEPRIRAVAALAPVIDVAGRLGPIIEQLPITAAQSVAKMSPVLIRNLTAEVFLCVADDDENVPLAPAQAFAARHKEKVTLQRIATGGHGAPYTQGMAPGMDFLATKLGAKGAAGAGKN